ncbi:MAG: aminotransferase class V-fold PLP-dependent enzyme [Planctomycetes bacterium]|nr:aminotransferase class V-fold PLP-dependent enzyme [Planctomycetota bacterium]
MNEHRQHWLLDEGTIFLNHGSFGACPRVVLEAQARLRAQLERQPLRFMLRELPALREQARARLAALVGGEVEGLVFVPNATTAVNAILRSLDLRPGDELLSHSQAYNACNNALRFVAERSGAKVVTVDLPFPLDDDVDLVERLMAAVTERTRLALVDHVTSATGLVLPVAGFCRALRERGVLSLVDGAHAPGMLPYSVTEMGCDFHTGNAHKWLCAPKGAAYLWCRAEHRSWLRPAVISHGANAPTDGTSRYHLEFDWTGTHDPTPYLSIPAALDFLEGLLPGGLPEIQRRNHALVLAGRRLLLERLGGSAPAPESMIGSIATIPLPPDGSDLARGPFGTSALQDRLLGEFGIELPLLAFPAPPARQLRISAQIYNDIEDYEALARALTRILPAEHHP